MVVERVRKHVVIIDEASAADFQSQALQDEQDSLPPMNIDTASTIPEIRQFVPKHAVPESPLQQPSVFIVNYDLPGIGVPVLSEILKGQPNAPVLLTSYRSNDEMNDIAKQHPQVKGVLRRPFGIDDYLEKVKHVLKENTDAGSN